jgi:hypothetical protein
MMKEHMLLRASSMKVKISKLYTINDLRDVVTEDPVDVESSV